MSERWLLSLIEEDMRRQNPLTEDVATVAKPKSRIQEILQEFYEKLKKARSPDAFDQFYKERLEDYPRLSLFSDFINEVCKKLSIDAKYPYFEKEWQEILFKITERRLEENDTLRVIKEAINKKYPHLVADISVDVTAEGVKSTYENFVAKEIGKIKKQLKKGDRKKFQDKIQKIQKAEETEIEELASELNRIVILGRETWELILYAIMSPFAPKININNLLERANLHFLFVGDVSTAKSKVDKIVERISPKATKISKSTEASFEGVAKQETIQEGIIDYANCGVLIIPEFRKSFERFEILREVMDCDTITIVKAGQEKTKRVNMTFFAGCNPRSDFFQSETTLRDQILFSDGVLSRIDILIPMMATKEKNELLVPQIDIFGTKLPKVTLEDMQERLKTLSTGMVGLVTAIILTEKQVQTIRQAFLSQNQKLRNRPLLVLRDLDTLCRLVNVITATNFPKRESLHDGEIQAEDTDVQKAIELWEEIIAQRKTLYTSKHRLIITLKEKIMIEILRRGNNVRQNELKKDLVEQGLCSAKTIERKINQLATDGKILKVGQRNAILKVSKS